MSRRNVLGASAAALVIAAAALASPVALANPREPGAWLPGPAEYGVAETRNVAIMMSDGTILRANVFRPADPTTGTPITDERFPVLLTQTPYGKSGEPADEYMVSRGYIHAVVDLRGLGSSDGYADGFGPEGMRDSVELVDWAANLQGSSGPVGLTGCSAPGIYQLLTAAAVGKDSPLKAIFPRDAANSAWRDLLFPGGIPSAFFTGFAPVVTAENATYPITDNSGDPTETVAVEGHRLGSIGNAIGWAVGNQTASPQGVSYYTRWWQARDPRTVLDRVVANDVPTFLTGGLYDLFQRGEPMNYAGLQNAFARRPTEAPMARTQPVSGKYQLLLGPWYHCAGGTGGPPGSDVDLDALQLRWFDRWLKDDRNGIDQTRTPLHVWEEKAGRWISTAVWPLTDRASRFYLDAGPSNSNAVSANDGILTPTAPQDPAAADTLAWDGAPVPCATAVPALSAEIRCASDDRPMQRGPTALTYTVDAGGKTLAGPGNATIRLTSTVTDAIIAATIDDVALDGTSVPVTGGILLGSHRAVDPSLSWHDTDGNIIAPYHPFSAERQQPIPPGEVVQLEVELFGTVWHFAPGHKLRLTLKSSAAPWALPSAAQIRNLAGGVYQVQRNHTHPSFVNLPLVDTANLPADCSVCLSP